MIYLWKDSLVEMSAGLSQLGLTSTQHKNLCLETQRMGHCSLVDSLTRQGVEAGSLNSLPLSTIMKSKSKSFEKHQAVIPLGLS